VEEENTELSMTRQRAEMGSQAAETGEHAYELLCVALLVARRRASRGGESRGGGGGESEAAMTTLDE
jgi:hypothetical protein